jgi:alkanesulfonate monooxygenase SsuD/methylene tetrahydromethanopterin reductase-like flavin-dependent oxidoreductase (luciferase family)
VPFPPLAERFERLEETLQICLQMWSDDSGPYDGKHFQLAETLCSPAPVSSPRPRILIGGSGERKTLRLVAQYADACNIFGGADVIAHKLDVLRHHCDDQRRDFADIEVTCLVNVDGDSGPEEILATCRALSTVGVQTVMARSSQAEPSKWLEETWGPVMAELSAIGS